MQLSTNVHMVPVGDIGIPPSRVRQFKGHEIGTAAHEAFVALAADIKANGLLNPITLATNPDGTIELVAGRHRLEAHIVEGLSHIPALFLLYEANDDATRKLNRRLVEITENLNRMELSAVERGAHVAEANNTLGELINARHQKEAKAKKEAAEEAARASKAKAEATQAEADKQAAEKARLQAKNAARDAEVAAAQKPVTIGRGSLGNDRDTSRKVQAEVNATLQEKHGMSKRSINEVRNVADVLGLPTMSALSNTSLDATTELNALVKLPTKLRADYVKAAQDGKAVSAVKELQRIEADRAAEAKAAKLATKTGAMAEAASIITSVLSKLDGLEHLFHGDVTLVRDHARVVSILGGMATKARHGATQYEAELVSA